MNSEQLVLCFIFDAKYWSLQLNGLLIIDYEGRLI